MERGEHVYAAFWHRAIAFQVEGDHRHAVLDYDRCLALPDTWRRPTAFALRAESLLALGRTSEAVQSVADAVADLTANPDPNYAMVDPEACAEDKELNRREGVAQECHFVAEGIRDLEASGRAPPNSLPLLKQVKAVLASVLASVWQ